KKPDKPSFDPQRSQPVETTADRIVYRNPDNTYTMKASTGPARVKDDTAPGGWRDLDLTLEPRGNGRLAPKVNLREVSVGETSDTSLADVAVPGGVLSLNADGIAAGRRGTVANGHAPSVAF